MEVRVDSKLLAMQVTGRWCCAAPTLRAFYKRALTLIDRLKTRAGIAEVEVVHVYREYNADADGICNEVLDMPHPVLDRYGFTINRGWRTI